MKGMVSHIKRNQHLPYQDLYNQSFSKINTYKRSHNPTILKSLFNLIYSLLIKEYLAYLDRKMMKEIIYVARAHYFS